MNFSGVFPPLPTPFDEDGALDLSLLTDLVSRLNASPLAGYLALGSNGEAPHVSRDEAEKVFRAVRRAAPPEKLVLAGTGQNSTRATVEWTKTAAGCGCDAALVVTPFYFKGLMQADELTKHFETVAGHSPIPVLLYNVPQNTGLNIAPSTVARIAAHPNVAGIKDSSGDIAQLAEIIRTRPQEKPFSVLSGSYPAALPGYAVGASGAILAAANIAPAECVQIRYLFLRGELDEARDLHLRILPAARAVTAQMGVPGLKAALEMLGMPAGLPRLPLLPLALKKRSGLRQILASSGLLGG